MEDRSFVGRIQALATRPLDWLGAHERGALVTLALAGGAIWGFVELADEVLEGEADALDARILLALRNPLDHTDPLGPTWVEEMGRDLTALGGVAVLALLSALVFAFLLMQRKRRAAMLVLAAVVGGLALSQGLKGAFDRPRPDLVPHLSHVHTSSFPSGHSMMSAATYLTLGALLARVQPRRSHKAYLLVAAVLITTLVGVSRVYLGVHWPTDVLAGWSLGAAWALLCSYVAGWLQRRGKVEPPTATMPDEEPTPIDRRIAEACREAGGDPAAGAPRRGAR